MEADAADTADAPIRFDDFWTWLETQAPQILAAQTTEGDLFLQPGLHWWLYVLPDGGARVSLVYGKLVVGTVVLPLEAARVQPAGEARYAIHGEGGEAYGVIRLSTPYAPAAADTPPAP